MNNIRTDLIAIANADLAAKLEDQNKVANEPVKRINKGSFKQDVWKAVYTLNIIRYLIGIVLLFCVALTPIVDFKWTLLKSINYPFIAILLISAVLFSYASKYRKVEFNTLVLCQFSFDIILAAFLIHSNGGIDSNFTFIYILVVATGSVVLPRKQALGLASGTIILLFSEHLYSQYSSPDYLLLVKYSLSLFAVGVLISYLAERIREAESSKFTPGKETIDDFLEREEIDALKAALRKTDGNKTKAAGLLGMSFRSFRYKLSKYSIA